VSPAAVDHRRAVAERNAAAILDAAERLLARRTPLSMAAIAAEAAVSRPTLYAHYATIGDVVEAAVERAVVGSLAAFAAARLQDGPAPAALLRMAEASLDRLGVVEALARGAAAHVTPGAVHRTHEAMLRPLRELIERGRCEGAFRTDQPVDWQLSLYLALVHGADEHAAGHGTGRAEALDLLRATLLDVLCVRPAPAPGAPSSGRASSR
jgi:AcrR family transcriptional regulator